MKKALVILGLFIFGSTQEISATHVASGDIQYRYIGDSTGVNFQYLIILRLYRDITGAQLGAGNQLVSITNSCGLASISVSLPLLPGTGPNVIAPGLFDCVTPPTPVVPGSTFEYYEYRGVVVLPGKCFSYTFSYQMCCRNSSNNVVGQPNFWIQAFLNNFYGENSSPIFVSTPVRAFCTNRQFNWAQTAIEEDGDSVYFSLACVRLGLNNCVNYQAPYTALAPFPVPVGQPLTMNPNTGMISFFAVTQGTFYIAIEAREFRYDTINLVWYQVGYSNRDLQTFISGVCSPLATQGVILDLNAVGTYIDTVTGLPTVDYTCLDSAITLEFAVDLECSSISADGTDFRLTAPDGQPIPIKELVAICDVNDETNKIVVKLHKPLSFNGNYFLYSKIGNDGNTLTNKCGFPMAEFDTIQLKVEGCFETFMDIKNVTIVEDEHPKVEWYLDTVGTALNPFPNYLVNQYKILRRDPGQPNFVQIFAINDYKTMYFNDKSLGAIDVDAESYEYKVEVVVNGSTAVSSRSIFSILLKAKQNPIMGDVIDLEWNHYLGWPDPDYTVYLGKNEGGVWTDVAHVPPTTTQVNPTKDTVYNMLNPGLDKGDYRICVLATNPAFLVYEAWSNCIPFTIYETIPPPPPPADTLRIPNVFTPNNDGQNDVFYIENAETWDGPRSVQIFNRWGNVVYKTDKYDNMNAWDGTDPSGKKVADGVYFYVLDFTHTPTGENFQQNGNITIFGN